MNFKMSWEKVVDELLGEDYNCTALLYNNRNKGGVSDANNLF